MSIKHISGIVFLFACAFSAYVPDLLTRGEAKISGGELAAQYPERAWIRFVYPVFYPLVFFGTAVLFVISFQSESFLTSGDNWLFIMGGVLGCLPLFSGVFTLLTGVIPINRRRQHLYVINEDISHQVGFILVGLGVFAIMASGFAIWFWV